MLTTVSTITSQDATATDAFCDGGAAGFAAQVALAVVRVAARAAAHLHAETSRLSGRYEAEHCPELHEVDALAGELLEYAEKARALAERLSTRITIATHEAHGH